MENEQGDVMINKGIWTGFTWRAVGAAVTNQERGETLVWRQSRPIQMQLTCMIVIKFKSSLVLFVKSIYILAAEKEEFGI